MCLLVIFMVVAYDVLVIRPFSDQTSAPTARYYLDLPDSVVLTQISWHIFPVSVLIQMPGNLHRLIC